MKQLRIYETLIIGVLTAALLYSNIQGNTWWIFDDWRSATVGVAFLGLAMYIINTGHLWTHATKTSLTLFISWNITLLIIGSLLIGEVSKTNMIVSATLLLTISFITVIDQIFEHAAAGNYYYGHKHIPGGLK